MIPTRKANGFSLIEILLVLAILGIISGIAIPSYLGQRRRARLIGDAQANAQVLRMQMESYRAEIGTYGASGSTYAWTAAGGVSGGSVATAMNFTPKGNSRMNYSAAIGGGGLTYVISVTDPSIGSAVLYSVNQAGSAVVAHY
jgi:prepilin-type N-terminal cleavage/methylation domain-containing protein